MITLVELTNNRLGESGNRLGRSVRARLFIVITKTHLNPNNMTNLVNILPLQPSPQKETCTSEIFSISINVSAILILAQAKNLDVILDYCLSYPLLIYQQVLLALFSKIIWNLAISQFSQLFPGPATVFSSGLLQVCPNWSCYFCLCPFSLFSAWLMI